jgi:hypothetical protein
MSVGAADVSVSAAYSHVGGPWPCLLASISSSNSGLVVFAKMKIAPSNSAEALRSTALRGYHVWGEST